MMQMTIHQIERKEVKRKLNSLHSYVETLMEDNEWACQVKERNRLVRYVWDNRNPYQSSESITRVQRKILAERPELDTRENVKKRANTETAFHEYFS